MEIIVAGDSWTFGSEIKDPNLSHVKDWDKENNAYRIPKIWPTKYGIDTPRLDCDSLYFDSISVLISSCKF